MYRSIKACPHEGQLSNRHWPLSPTLTLLPDPWHKLAEPGHIYTCDNHPHIKLVTLSACWAVALRVDKS